MKRWLFGIALALLTVYALNIVLGMLAVKSGLATWRMGDVGEFVVVLACMAFFVAGLVADEKRPLEGADAEDDSNYANGGVRWANAKVDRIR